MLLLFIMSEVLSHLPERVTSQVPQIRAERFEPESLERLTVLLQERVGRDDWAALPDVWHLTAGLEEDAKAASAGIIDLLSGILKREGSPYTNDFAVLSAEMTFPTPDRFSRCVIFCGTSVRSINTAEEYRQRLAAEANVLLEQLRSPFRL